MNQPLRTFQSLLLLTALCGLTHAQERPSQPPKPKAERSAIANGLLGSSRSKQAAGVSLRQAMAIARENTGGVCCPLSLLTAATKVRRFIKFVCWLMVNESLPWSLMRRAECAGGSARAYNGC
ncbi:MAG: hypothetical protein CM15mP120_11970 [Pseudomonadota bacterium]|nr:MAG: hypothetical protein CM15mP120_11970 [Pseudomonadota bacterium]